MRGRFLPGVVALLVTAPVCAKPAAVGSVAVRADDRATQIIVELDRPAQYRLFSLSAPERVVLDILGSRLSQAALPLPAGHGAVRQLRAANRPDGSVRLVMDLNAAAESLGSQQRTPAGGQLRVVLRPRMDSAPDDVAGPTVTTSSAATTSVVALRSAAPVPGVPALAVSGVLANTRLATVPEDSIESEVGLPAMAPRGDEPPTAARDIIVAVDAGHGGKDPGAHGPHGVLEKDVTLEIARRLTELINSQPGMHGVLTRDQDEYLPLRGRMERARAAEADLFISIHADAVRNPQVQGASVYVLNEKGATDEAARRLAARENAADLIGGVSLGDKDRTLASVLMDVSQNASLSSSIEVGDHILKGIGRVGSVRKPRVLQAPFMVLKSPDVPSVLIETAYISNPAEERRLDDDAYRRRLARAIMGGVRSYFDNNPPRTVSVAAMAPAPAAHTVRHVIRRGETLAVVADRYNVSVRDLRQANRLRGNQVAIGQVLRIPLTQRI